MLENRAKHWKFESFRDHRLPNSLASTYVLAAHRMQCLFAPRLTSIETNLISSMYNNLFEMELVCVHVSVQRFLTISLVLYISLLHIILTQPPSSLRSISTQKLCIYTKKILFYIDPNNANMDDDFWLG